MARDRWRLALKADRVVDVEAGRVREGRVVVVRGERVEALLDPASRCPSEPRSST
jgi:hypothetical protein